MGSVGQIICLAAIAGYNLRTVYVIDRRGTIAYIDMAYNAGSPESFLKLRDAVLTTHQKKPVP